MAWHQILLKMIFHVYFTSCPLSTGFITPHCTLNHFSFPCSTPLLLGEVIEGLQADYQTWKGFPKFKPFHWLLTLSSVCWFPASLLSLIVTLAASHHPHPALLPLPLFASNATHHVTHVKRSQHNAALPTAVIVRVCERLSVSVYSSVCVWGYTWGLIRAVIAAKGVL